MEPLLEFRNVSKRFGNTLAVDAVSLSIQRGEFFSLLGPSGCGKTTLLRMAAGFEQPDTGRVCLDGIDITDLPPNRRPVNTIFQNYALFPHLSVRENLAFGLKATAQPSSAITPAVNNMLGLMQIESQANKKPDQLSGGQKQRVAIGRALINKPQVLLLDEPLAALDLKLRQQMLHELHRIQKEVGITFLYVTHDQTEAMSLSHRIAVMKDGHVAQLGNPTDIYESPQSRFVASFIGDANILDGTLASCDGASCGVTIPGLPGLTGRTTSATKPTARIHAIIRPERLTLQVEQSSDSSLNKIPVMVEDITFLGSHVRFHVRASDHRFLVHSTVNPVVITRIASGSNAFLTWRHEDMLVISATSENE